MSDKIWMHDTVLKAVQRCPHCGTAKPTLMRLGDIHFSTDFPEGHIGQYWAMFKCSTCADIVTAKTVHFRLPQNPKKIIQVDAIYPSLSAVDVDLPTQAQSFLTQAFECLNSPDGSAMLCGSAVDAMLKAKKLVKGSLYGRIDQAVEKGILTQDMADWAHSVRLGSNRPRHADEKQPHVSSNEAKQSYEFTKTLGYVLFTLPAKIVTGTEPTDPAINQS